MNDKTASYSLQLPEDNSVVYVIVEYLVHLCAVEGQLLSVERVHHIRQPQVLCVSTGSVLSKGIVDIIHWLSFRKVLHAKILHSLCGESKDEKRIVARGLRKVLSWVSDWNDSVLLVDDILCNPLSGPVLLDKKFRHRNFQYFVEYSSTSKVNQPHITAPDILLTMMISKWMGMHNDACDSIKETLPAIVRYVQNIRAELLRLEASISDQPSRTYFDTLLNNGADWIDEAAIDNTMADSIFKFTQKKVVCSSGSIATVDFQSGDTSENIAQIERTAQTLIDSVPWEVPSSAGPEGEQPANCSTATMEPLSDHIWETMQLPPGREIRKVQQITSLLEHIVAVLPPGGVAVEFCSGGGYVGIPLAVLRPDCTVLLTDMNSVSLLYAKKRVRDLGLHNVKFLRCELSSLEESVAAASAQAAECDVREGGPSVNTEEQDLLQRFDVGIALHACGAATDAVLRICTAAGASFVVSPCCYGFLQHAVTSTGTTVVTSKASEQDAANESCSCCASGSAPDSTDLASSGNCAVCSEGSASATGTHSPTAPYPQSAAFRAQGWQAGWFARLCRRADRTFWAHDSRAGPRGEHNAAGRLAMRAVDSDRLLCAREKGYEVAGAFMRPLEASVKNHVLVGRKKNV